MAITPPPAAVEAAPLTTTLNRIRDHQPCREGWEKLLTGLGKTAPDDEPLTYARIVEINGLDDALWCCRAEPQFDRQWRLFAVWCARQVQHLMTDPRSIAALDVAERCARGQATDEELAAAEARLAARPVREAARSVAAWAARAAIWAARAATWAAGEAAEEATWAAGAAAEEATRGAQRIEFLRVVNGGEQ